MEGCLGLSVDCLLVGRVDGSVAVVEVFDSSTFCRRELQHCGRAGGNSLQSLSYNLVQRFSTAGPHASLHLAPDRQPRQHPTTHFFTGRMPFLPPNQQRQSTEGYGYTNNCSEIFSRL